MNSSKKCNCTETIERKAPKESLKRCLQDLVYTALEEMIEKEGFERKTIQKKKKRSLWVYFKNLLILIYYISDIYFPISQLFLTFFNFLSFILFLKIAVLRLCINHPTFPLLIFEALMKPAFVLSLIPCHTTKPYASVLKCSRLFSTTFLFGFNTGKMSPPAKKS